MNTPDVTALVQQGIAAYQAGDRDLAYRLFTQVLQTDPRHEVGWLWMSAAVTEPAERRYCLERVVEVNPNHDAAKRGLSKFPADLASRSPLPEQPVTVDLPRCTFPGCTAPVSRAGHTLCYEHWKQSRRKAAPAVAAHLLTASQLGERLELSSQRVNRLLAELGWIEQQGPNWLPTTQGQALGAVKRQYPESGRTYVTWPEAILDHKALRAAVESVRGDGSITSPTGGADQSFRKRFPAHHRTTDGHLVRSKAEMLIDNWLYMSEVVHAYERRLPIEEEVYCDFYLPSGKVYIEYWGLENDPAYNVRRQAKIEIYRRYGLKLIELTDEHIRNLDDHLPKMLVRYGIMLD